MVAVNVVHVVVSVVVVVAVAAAVVDAVVVGSVVVVVAAAVAIAAAVVVGSDVDVNARRPTCRLHGFLQHILHSTWRRRRCSRWFVHVHAVCIGSYSTSWTFDVNV